MKLFLMDMQMKKLITVTLGAMCLAILSCHSPDAQWYASYGPRGQDKVVRIGSIYVAKWTDNAGTADNGRKTWQAAMDWVEGMTWLGKDDWRMPTKDEIVSIYASRGTLGSYELAHYWSSTAPLGSVDCALSVYFLDGEIYGANKSHTGSVRAVRGGG